MKNRWGARDRDESLALGDAGGIGTSERSRIGVYGCFEHVARRPALDDATRVHHGDGVAPACDARQIVAQPDDRRTRGRCAFEHEAYDIVSHLGVQCSGRLVGHEDPRLAAHRDRNRDPLSHAARDLVGKQLQHAIRVGDLHAFEQRDALRRRVLLACLAQHEAQLVADSLGRVERSDRVLRHHPDGGLPQPSHVSC